MRISSLESDRGYHPHHGNCRFFLAGSERKSSYVVTADEERRTAVVYRLDEFGEIRRDKKGEALTELFAGDVVICCADWLRAAQDATGDEDEGALGAAIRALIQTP